MSRVRVCCSVALVLTVALPAAPGRAAEIPKPTHIAATGATCDAASIAGTLQSFAVPRRGRGKQRELLAVIAESPPPATGSSPSTAPPPSCHATNATLDSSPVPASTMKLVRLVTSDPPQLETLRTELPADTTGVVAFDVDGDGVDELLVATRDSVQVLRSGNDGAWSEPLLPWLTDPTLNWKLEPGYSPGSLNGNEDAVLAIPTFGRLRTFTSVTAESGAIGAVETESLPLPRLVESNPGGLRLSSPPVRRIGARSDGHALFATKPSAPSAQRFGVTLLDPLATGTLRAQELFLRLPSREKILEWRYLMDGDTAWLAVTSTSATELKLFGEKLLRLYPLEKDRTRGGATAGLALESRMNLWQTATFALTDVNGDGRRDLTVAYWKGLKDDTLTIDAYLRQADGGFARSARSTHFDLDEADRGVALFGPDIDGDGHADLLVRHSGNQISVLAGKQSKDGREVVEVRPRWDVRSLSSGESGLMIGIGASDADSGSGFVIDTAVLPPPALIDINADGVLDLVEAVTGDGSVTTLQVCQLDQKGVR